MLETLTLSSFSWWNSGRCSGHAGVYIVLAFAGLATGFSTAIVIIGNRSVSDFLSVYSYGPEKWQSRWRVSYVCFVYSAANHTASTNARYLVKSECYALY